MTIALASSVLGSRSGNGESLTDRAYKLVIFIAIILMVAIGLYLLFKITPIGDSLFGTGSVLGSLWDGTKFLVSNYTPIGWLFTAYASIGSSFTSWTKFRNVKSGFWVG